MSETAGAPLWWGLKEGKTTDLSGLHETGNEVTDEAIAKLGFRNFAGRFAGSLLRLVTQSGQCVYAPRWGVQAQTGEGNLPKTETKRG